MVTDLPTISITALHDPVSIVHIPIHLAESASSRIYWTVEDAPGLSNEFFNVTSNAIEIAIFGQTGLVDTYWADHLTAEIKLSTDWRVFEISSGDSGETSNYDSPHLRHVSTPLSREGISILYQSSYFTDFLLVKASDFTRASAIFAAQGWNVDPTAPPPSKRRSQLLSPATPLAGPFPPPLAPIHTQHRETPRTPELSVLPSPLACVGFSHALEGATAERVRQLVAWPEQARTSWQRKRTSYPVDSSRIICSNSSPTHPGSISDVDIGRPFISYTRTEDGASITTETKILRWMFGRRSRASCPGVYAPGESMYNSGIGSEGSEEDVEGAVDIEPEVEEDEEREEEEEEDGVLQGTEFQLGGQLAAGYVTDTTDLGESEAEMEEAEGDMERDEPPSEKERQKDPGPGPELGIDKDQQKGVSVHVHSPTSSHSFSATTSAPTTPGLTPGSSGPVQTIPISWSKAFDRRSPISCKTSVFADAQASISTSTTKRVGKENRDPRDQCANENDRLGPRRSRRDREASGDRKGRPGRKRCLQLDLRGVGLSNPPSDTGNDNTCEPKEPSEKAAATTTTTTTTTSSPTNDNADKAGENIYHLDKSGLVTLFSDLLNAQNIRMLYSSTFHTANILVEARDVTRARRLLEEDAKTSSSPRPSL